MTEKAYTFSSVASFRNIAILSLFSSILLQASFLYFLSPPLLSFMSLSRSFYLLAIFIPISGTIVIVFANAMEDYAKVFESGLDLEKSQMYLFRKFLKYTFIAISILIFLVSTYKFYFMSLEFRVALNNVKYIFFLAVLYFLVGLLDKVIITIADIRHAAETNGTITSYNLVTVFIFSFGIPFAAGSAWAYRIEGENCLVHLEEYNITANFLLALDGVSVFKLDDKISIINTSDIKRMDC